MVVIIAVVPTQQEKMVWVLLKMANSAQEEMVEMEVRLIQAEVLVVMETYHQIIFLVVEVEGPQRSLSQVLLYLY
jgi:hypothetical protein